MNAETRNVNELFRGTKTYRVRLYQRHYVWHKENWEKLWRDIKEKSDLRLKDESSAKKYFIGNIIIQPDGGGIELLNGQQRLITFQILLCAIRDIWTVFDNMEAAERVQRLIENEGFDESEPTGRYKLLPREGSDRETFLSIVEQKKVMKASTAFRREEEVYWREGETISDEGGERIQEAYWHFRSAIAKYVATDYDKLNNLYRTIVDDFTVIQIEVTSDDEWARVFELIRGDNTFDAFNCLRTNLFLRAGTGKVRDEFYRPYWHLVEEYRRSEYKLSREDKANLFLAHFLKAKGKIGNAAAILEPTPGRLDNRLYDAYQTYRGELSEAMNLDESHLQFVEHEFQELDRYAQVYQEIHDRYSEIGRRLEFSVSGIRKVDIMWYVSSRFSNALRQFILYIKNELGVSDSLLTSVFDLLESLIVRFVICTGETVDSLNYSEIESAEERLLKTIFGEPISDPSIFSRLEDCLLSNILDIDMKRNKLSSFRWFETPIEFRELKIFPLEVVEKALSDYCQNDVPNAGRGEDTDYADRLYARGSWGSLICYILYKIELIIAKEKGIAETDFPARVDHVAYRYGALAERLLEYYPSNIGNLTVCSSLWDVKDEWDVKEIVEREIKLIAYFNKRWPSIEDCLDTMIQPAKCELIGTDEGIKELSQIVVHDAHIEGIDRNDNQRVVLDKNNIFFTCAAAAWSQLKPYIQEDAELKERALEPIELSDEILRGQDEVMAVTRSGHVLRGKVDDFNEDAIGMEINGQDVIVFRQGLYEFETMERFEVQVSNFVQDPQNEQYGVLEFSSEKPEDAERFTKLFGEESKRIHVYISQVPNKDFHSLQPGQRIELNIAQTEEGLYARNIILRGVFYENLQAEERNVISTYEGTRELSQIVVHDTHIEGVDPNDDRKVVLDKNSLLFACSAKDWSIVKPYIQENAAVKERALKPIQSPAEKLQIKDSILKSDVAAAVTRSGHVLRGGVKNFDEDLIGMKTSGEWTDINGEEWTDINLIVFRQGLYEFEMMERFEIQVSSFVQDTQNGEYGVLEFSGKLDDWHQRRLTELFGEAPKKIGVHISQVPNADFRSLQPGQEIEFNIAQTEEGLHARHITQVVPETHPQRRRSRRGRRRARRTIRP